MAQTTGGAQGMNPLTLYCVDNCPSCVEVKPRVIEFCESRGIPLVVRKPSLSDMRRWSYQARRTLARFPLLEVPLNPAYEVSGSLIPEWLLENEQKVRDGYGVPERRCDPAHEGPA